MTDGPANTTRVATVGTVAVTSPDVAISLGWIYAMNGAYERFGRSLENVVVTMAPEQVSSIKGQLGAPVYLDGYPSTQVHYDWLLPGHPPWDAWLGCRRCAQEYGVQTTGFYASYYKEADKFCGTVWIDDYQPQLSVPQQIYSLQPDWLAHSCTGIFALFDPPKVLTQVTEIAGPSMAPIVLTSSAQPAPTTPAPTPPVTVSTASQTQQVSKSAAPEPKQGTTLIAADGSATPDDGSASTVGKSSPAALTSDGDPPSTKTVERSSPDLATPAPETMPTVEPLSPDKSTSEPKLLGSVAEASAPIITRPETTPNAGTELVDPAPASAAGTAAVDPTVDPSQNAAGIVASALGVAHSSTATQVGQAPATQSTDTAPANSPKGGQATHAVDPGTDGSAVVGTALTPSRNVGDIIASALGIARSSTATEVAQPQVTQSIDPLTAPQGAVSGTDGSPVGIMPASGESLPSVSRIPDSAVTPDGASGGLASGVLVIGGSTVHTADPTGALVPAAAITYPNGDVLTVQRQGTAVVAVAGSSTATIIPGSPTSIGGHQLSQAYTGDGVYLDGSTAAISLTPAAQAQPTRAPISAAAITYLNGDVLTVQQQGTAVVAIEGSITATLTPGSPTSIGGHQLSQALSGGNGIYLDGSTAAIPLTPAAQAEPTKALISAAAITYPDGDILTILQQGTTVVAIEGSVTATITPDSPTSIGGHQLSRAPSGGNGIYLDGSPVTISLTPAAQAQPLGGSQIVTTNPDGVVQTLQASGSLPAVELASSTNILDPSLTSKSSGTSRTLPTSGGVTDGAAVPSGQDQPTGLSQESNTLVVGMTTSPGTGAQTQPPQTGTSTSGSDAMVWSPICCVVWWAMLMLASLE